MKDQFTPERIEKLRWMYREKRVFNTEQLMQVFDALERRNTEIARLRTLLEEGAGSGEA